MNQEELKKNFILLSKVAKERKYAQEYLGLLARRGDLGSIRIGKRWYTTLEWFSEFEKDSQAKKAEMKIVKNESETSQIKAAEKIEIEKVILHPKAMEFMLRGQIKKVELKKNVEIKSENFQAEKSSSASQNRSEAVRENSGMRNVEVALKINPQPKIRKNQEKIAEIFSAADQPFQFRASNKLQRISPIKKIPADFSQSVRIRNNTPIRTQYLADISGSARFQKNILNEKKAPARLPEKNPNETRERTEEFQILDSAKRTSPVFLAPEKRRMGFFPKFAFVGSLVLLFFLISAFGYSHKKDILSFVGFDSGIVAGAEDSKTDLASLKRQSIDYLGNQRNEVKEKISLSRVIISAALSREK